MIGTRHYAGYIDNISIGGARLRTISRIGRLGDVLLRLPDLPALRCKLRWTDAYNAGVSFSLGLSPHELTHWARSRSGSSVDQTGKGSPKSRTCSSRRAAKEPDPTRLPERSRAA